MKRNVKRIFSFMVTFAILIGTLHATVPINATQNRDGNFSNNYTLTGNPRDDIVAVANAQYQKTKEQLGFTEAWCANFVCGCGILAGIPNFPRNGSCDQLIVLLQNWGGVWHAYNSSYVPKKGDIVFFSSKGNTSDDSTHVGIIYQDGFVSANTVKTIEGNTSGVSSSCVNIKNRAVYGSLPIMGYIDLTAGGTSSGSTDYSSTNPDDYSVPVRTLYKTSPMMRGSDVAWVQAVLVNLGYSLDIDGVFGSGSETAVKSFQSNNGLEVDGKVGPATRAKLTELWAAKKAESSHTHNFTHMIFDENGHQMRCECGELAAKSAHSYGGWTVTKPATQTQTGNRSRSCTVCGYTQNETIPLLPSASEPVLTTISDSVKKYKPVLDGLPDAEYLDSAIVTMSGGGDASVTSYITWYGKNLYICSVVQDNDIMSPGADFFAKKTGYSQNMLWGDTIAYELAYGGWVGTDALGYALWAGDSCSVSTLRSCADGDITPNKKNVSVTRTANGYISEVCIPIDTANTLYSNFFSNGNNFNFTLYLNDAPAGASFDGNGIASDFTSASSSCTLKITTSSANVTTDQFHEIYGAVGSASTDEGANYVTIGQAVINKAPSDLVPDDAVRDAAYDSSYRLSFSETVNSRKLSGNAYFLWDSNYLYIYADIDDPDRFAQIYSLDDPSKNDLAVFRVFGSDGNTWAKIGVNATNTVNPSENPVHTDKNGYLYVMQSSDAGTGLSSSVSDNINGNKAYYATRLKSSNRGYAVELKIPMNSQSLKAGQQIRLSFGALDVNGTSINEHGASGTYDTVVSVKLRSKTICTHSWIYEEHAANCTEGGYRRIVCEKCNAVLSEISSAPAGHNFSNGNCTVCGVAGTNADIPNTDVMSVPGDMNGDGNVDSDDAIYLQNHVGKPSEYPISQSGDLDGDGEVGENDAVYLARHLFSPEEYPIG